MDAVEMIIQELRGLGLYLFVEDGTVHGRMQNGGRMPMRARQLAEDLRLWNDAAVRILEAEQIHEVEMLSAKDARIWKQRIENGEIEMIGKVVYNSDTGVAVLRYRNKRGGKV